jgi:hypothetical protein
LHALPQAPQLLKLPVKSKQVVPHFVRSAAQVLVEPPTAAAPPVLTLDAPPVFAAVLDVLVAEVPPVGGLALDVPPVVVALLPPAPAGLDPPAEDRLDDCELQLNIAKPTGMPTATSATSKMR